MTLDTPVRAVNRIHTFTGQCAPHLGMPLSSEPLDRILLDRLLTLWEAFFILGKSRASLRRLFRSIEIAYGAMRYPSEGFVGLYDLGTVASLWVSAFEVLLRSDRRSDKIDLRGVQRRLAAIEWRHEALRARSFPEMLDSRKRVTLAEAIYADLYRARDKFLHGEPFEHEDLYFRNDMQQPLLATLIPVVYYATLRYQLAHWLGPEPVPRFPSGDLLTSRGKRRLGAYARASVRRDYIERPSAADDALLTLVEADSA